MPAFRTINEWAFTRAAMPAPEDEPLKMRLGLRHLGKIRYLVMKENKIVLSENKDNEVMFKVLDADCSVKDTAVPVMKPVSRAET